MPPAGLTTAGRLLHTVMRGPTILVRYGAIPEVARFEHELADAPRREERVVVNSHRGLELGTTLENLRQTATPPVSGRDAQVGEQAPDFRVLRRATDADEARHAELRREADQSFSQWQQRIREWNLDLELLDIEWTLDRQKLVLYVL